jgi:hypothetical protein
MNDFVEAIDTVENGVTSALAGDDELTNGIAGAGINLAAGISNDLGDFFKSVSNAIASGPDVVAYAVAGVTLFVAWRYGKKVYRWVKSK